MGGIRLKVTVVTLALVGLFGRGNAHVPDGGSAGAVDGWPASEVTSALHMLLAAADEGLEPSEYDLGNLTRLAEALSRGAGTAAEKDEFERRLTAAVALYVRHVHRGRVDPRQLGFRLTIPDDRHDFERLVAESARTGGIAGLVRAYRPPGWQYPALLAALRHYRSLRELPPLVTSRRAVRVGDPYEGLGGLFDRLALYGDMPASTPRPELVYRPVDAAAVRRFQERHGLQADGVLGPATFAALQVPLSWRIRQIELALERLRWLPHQARSRLVVLNIPMFELGAWDRGRGDQAPSFRTGVIVGRAMGMATPVMAQEIREIVFRPYWNIPRSILLNEVLTALAKDPGYLGKHAMEIVAGDRDDSPAVPLSADALTRLRRGELRLRQRPGPQNALGLVKFVFPNEDQVYMHDTPAQSLFSRARRDFSHGCVRIEDPVGLAEWLLAGQADWSRTRVIAAMNGSRTMRVALASPAEIWLLYLTAVVMPDGTLRFADDIYGHDRRLDQALAARRTARQSPGAHASDVDVHEVRSRIESDAAPSQGERRLPQLL
ncbi:MAG: murein L,D-transpeptidase [Vicinamibacterales bacterium]